MKKITIVLVDDHRMLREIWTKLFSKTKNLEVIGESGELHQAVRVIRTTKPDIV